MRKLKETSDHKEAQDLADFLLVQGIATQVRELQGTHSVWVVQEADVVWATELVKEFSPTEAGSHRAQAEALRKKQQAEAKPVFTPQRSLGRSAATPPWGAGVVGLFLICGLVAAVSRLGQQPTWSLYIAPVDLKLRIFLPFDWSQPWRLVTPIFLHSGLFHLGFNLMWLRQLGSQVESNAGTVRFLLLVVVTAALSNLAQYLLFHPQFGGMSGVNYALFAYVWMQARYAPKSRYEVTSSTTWLLMVWLVLCGTGLMGPVANAAHAFGLIFGLAFGLPTYLRFRKIYNMPRRPKPGSAHAEHIRGFDLVRRYYFEPYAPAWFVMVALVVAAWDYL